MILTILITILVILTFLKIYCVVTLGICSSTSRLDGKVALVTGSNRGIGYQTALNLAKRGAKVIITSENLQDLQRAHKQMILESGNKNIVAKHLDLLSLSGIRTFAKEIIDVESRLDILVNNAGIFGMGDKMTIDGLRSILQVNYCGPFLLTHLLLGLLKQSSPSRIVNVASTATNIGFGFESTNITSIHGYKNNFLTDLFEYSNSKICVTSSSIEMAKRLKGTGVTVNCLHPGIVHTQIYYYKGWSSILAIIGRYITMKNPVEGAQTSIHLAACENVEGVTGKYFRDCRPSWIWANLGSSVRNSIWDQSVKLVGLKTNEMLN